MWQQSDELTKVLEKKLNSYFDTSKESTPILNKNYILNNLTESNYSFSGPSRPQQSIPSQTDLSSKNRYTIQVIPNSDNSTNYSNASPSKLESFLSARYQVKSKPDMSMSKYTFSARQSTEIPATLQTEAAPKFTTATTGSSIDYRFSEESLRIPRNPSLGESAQNNNNKPELLTARSLLSLRREKLSSSPASQIPQRTPPKFDHMNTDNVSDNFELASQFSLVFSDKPTEPHESDKPELHLLNETGNNGNLEAASSQQVGDSQKVAGIIGLWKMESLKSLKSNRSQTQKLKAPQEAGQTDIMNNKNFVVGPGGPGTSSENTSRMSRNSSAAHTAQRSIAGLDAPVFLDSLVLQTGPKTNNTEYLKRGLTYNFSAGTGAGAESNTLDAPSSTQGSQKFIRGSSKPQTMIEKDTSNKTNEQSPPIIQRMKTFDGKELPRLIIQAPANLSPQTKYMNALKKAPPEAEKEEKKQSFPNIKVLFKDLVYGMIIIKRKLRLRYLKNRKEVYKYEVKDDPPVIKVVNRNKELVRKRNKYCKEDKKFNEKELIDIQEGSKIEYFDSTGFGLLSTKNTAVIPANGNDPQSGKVVKSGFVKKLKFKSKINHQRWIVLRSFNIYWYNNTYSSQPKGIVNLTTTPIKEVYDEELGKACMIIEQSRGRDFIFQSDYGWKVALMNEIAFKSYLEYMRENHLIPNTGVIEYFENEGCRSLDLAESGLNDLQLNRIIYESLAFHPKLKELNLAKTQVRGKQLEDLITNLINLKKHSKLETLNLDSNGMNKDSISHITRYLESESSFNLKRLTLGYNPIGDDGIQVFMESVLTRFEKMNTDNKNKLILPFIDLDLSGTRTGDQSIFTLITVFDQINKRFGDRGVEDHRDLISLKLSDNLISDNGLRALAKALTKFHGLKELSLSNNPRLTGYSFTCLLTHLKKSSSLAKVEYKKNAIDIKGMGTLFSNLADNFLLKKLSITLDEKMIEAFIGNEEVTMDFYKVISENKF